MFITVAGMEETSCERKEVLQDLVGDISNYWVTEGPFGRIRTKHNDTVCEFTDCVFCFMSHAEVVGIQQVSLTKKH